MSDVLVGMLAYKHPNLTAMSVASIGTAVDRLFIANGASSSVRAVLPAGETIRLHVNIGVNPGWNILMRRFLDGEWDWLVIASNDVIMCDRWADVLHSKMNTPKAVFLPRLVEDMTKVNDYCDDDTITVAYDSTPGFFFCMPREAVTMVYPIPEQIKIWFGDEWIFTRLRRQGWHTYIANQMVAHHSWSSNITDNCRQLIEDDKIAWEEVKKLL